MIKNRRRRMRSRVGPGALCITLIAAANACASSTPAPASAPWMPELDGGAFVTTLGSDTIAVEQFALRTNVLDVHTVLRTPRTTIRSTRMEWDGSGTLRRYETAERDPGGEDSVQIVLGFTTRRDSVYWTEEEGLRRRAVGRLAARNPRLVLAPAIAAVYLVPARLVHLRGDSSAVMVSQNGAWDLRVSRPDPNWITFSAMELGTIKVRVDGEGRAQEVDARESTLGTHARRVALIELDALTRRFMARDTAGQGLGALSPADTVRAQVAGANVTIAYSRPSRRGRVIFGGLVPWDRVWRTGANAATGFATDRDLLIGDTRVPAGSYTLWSLPSRDGWQLILNRQTGQWGTQYDQAQDVARIPMRVETLSAPVERFTIALEPGAGGGTLSLAWDNRRGTVAVRSASQ